MERSESCTLAIQPTTTMKIEAIDKIETEGGLSLSAKGSYQETALFLVDVLYKHYTDQRRYGTKPLTILEESFIDAVDIAKQNDSVMAENEAGELLEEAYRILAQKPEWDVEEQQLYEMLEKIILLGTKKGSLRQVFEDIGEITASMMELDFSKRLNVPEGLMNGKNLLNYIGLSLNMVNEELEAKAMPKSVCSDIIATVANTAVVFATDVNGKLTFVSNFAYSILGIDRDDMELPRIEDLLGESEKIRGELHLSNWIESMLVTLLPVGEKKKETKAFLTVRPSFDEHEELKAHIYSIEPAPLA